MPGTLIYLDHAATSWPKPPEVVRAMSDFLENAGSNPGRSAHRLSVSAGRIVYETRERLARLFNVADPQRVIFTANATASLNLALQGFLRAGDRVVTSSMEHNSMLRPLRALEAHGVQVEVVQCAKDGTLDPADLKKALAARTRLVAITHASNVTGTLLPVRDIARLAHAAGASMLVDAAQTAGSLSIDVEADGIDLLAFTGHKGLHGPPGTGGLVLGSKFDERQLEPLLRGGTGSRSDSQHQPTVLPDKYESGTPNSVGIAGLGAGVQWVMAQTVEALREKEQTLARILRDGLREIPGVTVCGPRAAERSVAVVSFTAARKDVATIGEQLDEHFGVLCRVGLHCAPAAHQTIGTFPSGTVRLAPGPLATKEEMSLALDAVRKVVASA